MELIGYEDKKRYGVMCEWVDEPALVMESKPMTFETAKKHMEGLRDNKRVIRVAIVELVVVKGNENIAPQCRTGYINHAE